MSSSFTTVDWVGLETGLKLVLLVTPLAGEQLSKMIFSLLLAVLPPAWGQDPVSSPDRSCLQQEVCARRTSCPYWVEREAKYKAGEDPSYVTDARAQICNKQGRALCCPRDVEVESPTFIPKAGQCGNNAEAVFISKTQFVFGFGGRNTLPGDYPFSALLGFVVLK